MVGAGPWVRDFWNMLELPKVANIKGQDGIFLKEDMWKFWMLLEGVIGVDADFLKMNNGQQPPVIHVDSTAPLYSDKTKKLITDKIWGMRQGAKDYIVKPKKEKELMMRIKEQGII